MSKAVTRAVALTLGHQPPMVLVMCCAWCPLASLLPLRLPRASVPIVG